MKLDLQFFAKSANNYNDIIDQAKQGYNNAKTQAEKDAWHQVAENARSEASKAGLTVGNYVSSGSGTKSNIDTSNYSSAYDVSTNYSRPADQVEEEKPFVGGSDDYNSLVKSLANAQKEQQKANLQKALANTLSTISSQEEATKTNTKNAKNNAEAQKMLNDKRMANTFANLGLTNSGTNAQSIINSNGALQNVLGGLDANNQTALNELARQKVLAQSNYESDLANAYAGIDANALSNQLNYLAQMNQMQQQLANQKELAKLDLEYNNIWDNNLGRYVPFSYYQASNGIGKTGGSGTSSNSFDEQIMKSYLTYYNSVLQAGGKEAPMSYTDYYNAMFGTKPADSSDLSNEDKNKLIIQAFTGKEPNNNSGMTTTVKPSIKDYISNMFK